MVPDFHLLTLNSNRTKVGMWEDKGKHADVVSWNQCFNIYSAGEDGGFFNGQQPFPSYLLQGKIVGAGGGGGICLDHSCFLAPVYCLASHFGLLSNLPGQTTSMQGAQVQNKIQSRDTETWPSAIWKALGWERFDLYCGLTSTCFTRGRGRRFASPATGRERGRILLVASVCKMPGLLF